MWKLLVAAVGALTTVGAGLASADDFSLVGALFRVTDPLPGKNPHQRTLAISAQGGTPSVIASRLADTGLTIEFFAGGPASSASQAFVLPPGRFREPNGPGWKGAARCRGSSCTARYRYIDERGENGAIVFLRLDSRSGLFGTSTQLTARADGQGNNPTIEVTPPNPGDRAGAIVTIPDGTRICAFFGGVAGGRVLPPGNTATTFRIKRARAAIACPPAPD